MRASLQAGRGQVGLSVQQVKILALTAQGWTDAQIGRELALSPRSIPNIWLAMRRHLGAHNRPHGVAVAFERGILQPGGPS